MAVHILKSLIERKKLKRSVRLSRSRFGTVSIFIFLAIISIFMALPLFYAIIQSVKPLDEIFAYPPRFFVRNPTIDNFRQVFILSDNLWVPFTRYLFNSFLVSVAGTVIYVLFSTAAAYPLAKGKFSGKALMSQLVVLTLLFSAEVTTVPRYIIVAKLGLADTYGALILPYLAGTLGVFLVRQFILSSIPDSTLEAARIDGASEYRIFFTIILPSVKPAWLTLTILAFKDLWNSGSSAEFIYSENLKGLNAALASISTGGLGRTGAACAIAVLMMIPPILIFLYSQNSVMETMTHSGLK